jgi:adenylosuccinate synthase
LTELALTKLDVLTGLDPLRICQSYRCNDPEKYGQEIICDLPFGPGNLDCFTPIYEDLPGWDQDLQSARTWEDLPAAAREYILRIEKLAGIPIRLVSVGPERDQMVEIPA